MKRFIAFVVMLLVALFVLPASPTAASGWWVPAPHTSWQWVITGSVDPTLNVAMYDIDLYDSQPAASSYVVPGFGTVNVPKGPNAGIIANLHNRGRIVICYLDTGAWESYRPDQALFPKSVIGNSTGWSGERWLDIRQKSWPLFEPLIAARLDLAVRSGCDGVEPDQNNPIGNNPGFPITLADQGTWYLHIAALAHARNLSVGMKNGIESVNATMAATFDWALNEECWQYRECSLMAPFVNAGKAVFHVEYRGDPTQWCPKVPAGFSSMKKKLSLNNYRVACPNQSAP